MTDLEIQEVKNKKRFLKRYKKNLANIERLKNDVISLDDRMLSIRSPKLSDMPRGGTPVSFTDLQAEKDEILDRIKRLEVKGRKLKSEILDKIDELEDVRYAIVLESYFIKCKDFDEIADENNYTMRHIVRKFVH